jgi:RNA polymerase sigma-70 factor, ECF subfamily
MSQYAVQNHGFAMNTRIAVRRKITPGKAQQTSKVGDSIHSIAAHRIAHPASHHLTPLSERIDDDLVELAKRGDEDAFAELMLRHHRFCLAKAYLILGNLDDVQDAVQTSWMQAWAHLSSYQGQASFKAWLSRIVSNACLMQIRATKRADLISVNEFLGAEGSFRLEVVDQRALPEEIIGKAEIKLILRQEIRRLPTRLREILLMHEISELTMQDTALHLGITVSAAKSRLLRARRELRVRMTKRLGENGDFTFLRELNPPQTIFVRSA